MKIPHPLRGFRDEKVRVCVGHKTCHPDELVRRDLPEVRRFCLTAEVIARSGSLERANAWISAFAEMTCWVRLKYNITSRLRSTPTKKVCVISGSYSFSPMTRKREAA